VADLQRISTIDLVAVDADGTCLLVMVDDRPWNADPAQETQLRDKINTYASYVTSGELVDAYPEVAGKPVRIQLHCVQEPTGRIATVVQHAASELHNLGISFVVNVRG
jgi:hypothetical protein